MVDLHDLSNAKVDVLTAAATSWEQIATKLRAMDGEWNSVVIAKVNGSGWTGKSSELAKPALQRGNDQLGAAATEAAAIASVLSEAAKDIQAAKDKATAVVAEITAAGYTVSQDGGTVNWPAPDKATAHDPEASRTYQDKCRATAEGFQQRIGNVLREATEADQRACFALRADATTDKDGSFNAQAVGGGPEADAKRAAQLAAKGRKLTDPELLELNSLLAAHGGDPVFTTSFYEKVGPKGLLVFWDNMVGADSGVGGVSDTRLQQYQDLQKNLGTTLATATRTSNQPHLSDQWAADLRKAGAELLSEEPPVGMGTRPYIPRGYQVLAGILRTGNYDPHFLDPIAEHVVQLDAKDTNRTRPFWPDFGGDKRGIFNIVGQDGAAGYQPLTGILEALGHSPEAATKFFHDQPTAYNTDGTVNPNGKPRPADYLHYLAHDKEFKPDTLSYDKDAQAKSQASGPLAFGHALEAATSGHPYDETPNPPLKHRADQAAVMTKVMDEFGHTTDGGSLARITGKDAPLAALRPSLGHLVADYMGDVQHSFSKFDNTLPVNGAPANLDTSHVRAVLNQLGRDPEAYGSVINAQQAYTTALIHREFAGGETNAAKLALPIDNAASSGGAIAGILNEARADAVFKEHAASDKAYNDAVANGASWARGAFDTVVYQATAVVPGAGAAGDFIFGQMLQSIVDSTHKDTLAVAQDVAGQQWDSGRSASGNSAAQAVRDAAVGSGLSGKDINDLAANAGHSAVQGGAAGAVANRTAGGKG
ncbi:hypothetical protein AB0F92_21595 [Kitasatospora aureofaciens]|uniref:hypothetical protein n=1 Tax=Kitasatospora aureofaciens TaxID=1894 RepID=UPI0033F84658